MISLGLGTAFTFGLLNFYTAPPIEDDVPDEIASNPDGAVEQSANKYLAYTLDSSMVNSKIRDPELVLSCLDENSMLLLGSSELTRGTPNTSPTALFYNKGYDADFCLVGDSGCQSLWAAMEIAALSPNLKTRKVAFILSQYWTRFNPQPAAFQKRYSPKVMKMMMDNGDLSDDTETAIMKRAETLLAGSDYQNQAKAETPLELADSYANCLADSLRITDESTSIEFPFVQYVPVTQSVDNIDWNALLAQAKTTGTNESSNNPYGILNDEWTATYSSNAQGSESKTNLSNSLEYDDLGLFCRTCQELGIEPLLIMTPMKNSWSDFMGISNETRQAFFDKVKAIAAQYDAQIADFSSYGDDIYFMDDPIHIGWEGWPYVEKAIIEFYRKN